MKRKINNQSKKIMFRLKFYAAMFALVIGLSTSFNFNQTARAESWSVWENILSVFSSENAVAVCTPNPEKIAFVSLRDDNQEIYVMNADGTNQTNLTNNLANDSESSFSADGNRIAFRSNRDGNFEIYVMNADGTNLIRLTNNSADDSVPSFSPDGNRIAFRSNRDGNQEIYVMNVDGTNQTNLTNNSGFDNSPSFSADSSRIAFASTRDGNGEIYVMNVNGTNQTRLTNNSDSDSKPSFNADDSRIAFVSTRDGDNEIYVMNANGTNQTRLTNILGRDVEPSFSVDGSRIAFRSERDGIAQIYAMNADGTNQTRLSNFSGNDLYPSWGRQTNGTSCTPTPTPTPTVTPTPTPNTPTGNNVTVQTSFGDARATFAQVIVAGNTTFAPITPPSSAGTPPAGYTILNDAPAYDITTTATYTPPVTVCFTVSSINDAATFARVRILHGENGQLVDRTILAPDTPAPDFATRSVCARVNSLSPFVASLAPAATPPSVASDAYSVNEDTMLNINAPGVLGNDTDAENNALTAQLQTSPANAASFALNADGSFSYTPNANFNGTDSFTYTASDGSLSSNTASVTITVNAVNDAPTANGGSISTDEDTPSSPFTLTGADADNDALTFEIVTAPVKGTYNAATGIYTPNANANGSDSFTFIAKDASSQSSAATVSITINPVNDAPTATAQSVMTAEDTAKAITLSGADVDGDSLTYSASQPSQGSVSCTGTSCIYTPTANYNGTDSFTYTASDGSFASNAATVTITVNAVNDNPDAVNDSATVAEDSGANTINVLGNDNIAPDTGETLTVSAVTQGANGSVAITNGGADVSYTPNANFNGTDSFTYTISDGNGGSDTATVNITVTSVNDDPTAANDSATVTEDSGANSVSVRSNDSDVDGDTLSVTSVTQGANGTAAITGGGTAVSYTPNANFSGTDTFTYTISDGNGATATATVNVTVTAVNDAPDAVDNSVAVNEDSGANTINVRANDTDIDGDTLTITAKTNGANGTVAITGGGTAVSYTPNANFFGMDSFTYTISDGNGGSDTATVNVTVRSVNDNPDAVNDGATFAEDSGANTINVRVNDSIAPDTGETLTVTAVTQGTNGAVAITNGGANVSYTPNLNFFGSDSFTYTVSDGNGGSDSATVNVNVTPVNDNPAVAVAAGGSCAGSGAGGTMNLAVGDVETTASGLSLSASSSNTTLVPNGNIVFDGSGANRTVTITAVPQRNAQTATLTITVSDGQGGSSFITITVKVGTNKNETITGTSGADMILGLNGDDTVNAGSGNDLVCGGNGVGTVNGGAGDDTIDGGNGNDTLRGDAGNDLLIGGSGNDRLEGGNDNDTLTGGSGADSFSGGPGVDTATDFTTSQGDTNDGTVP